MSRKSNFTEQQWADISRRHVAGESLSDLARELGCNESTLRSRFARKGTLKTVQEVAGMVHEATMALEELPPGEQAAVKTLVARWRAMAESMTSASMNSARTCDILSEVALRQAMKINRDDPLKTPEQVRAVVALTDAANKAGVLPSTILLADKEKLSRLTEDSTPVGDETLTPERRREGVRRMAFLLHKAGLQAAKENG